MWKALEKSWFPFKFFEVPGHVGLIAFTAHLWNSDTNRLRCVWMPCEKCQIINKFVCPTPSISPVNLSHQQIKRLAEKYIHTYGEPEGAYWVQGKARDECQYNFQGNSKRKSQPGKCRRLAMWVPSGWLSVSSEGEQLDS